MSELFAAVGAAIKVTGLFGPAAAATGQAALAAGGLSTISSALTIGSALASIGGGIAQSKNLKAQAAEAGLNATEEERAGASRAADLARDYADLVSEQTVIQLANGLNIGVGTPVNIHEATKRHADRNIRVTRENARNRARIARLRQRGLLSEARASLAGGFGRAGTIALGGLQLTG